MTLKLLKKTLLKYSSRKRKKSNELYFKTEKGQYGYGDKFIGVTVPNIRKVSLKFKDLSLSNIKKLLQSKIHEERLTALLILVNKFETGDNKKKRQIYNFYLKHSKYINNWDLVDSSAYKIVGTYILENPKEETSIKKLTESKNLWERRISIVSTFTLIKNNKYNLTIKNSKKLLSDTQDLTHKAVGWMLREVWKKDNKLAEDFIIKNYKKLPRTTLRYTIERMEKEKRQNFLKGRLKQYK